MNTGIQCGMARARPQSALDRGTRRGDGGGTPDPGMAGPNTGSQPGPRASVNILVTMRILRLGLLLAAGFYGSIALSLFYLREFPPLTTGVQLQRRVEAMLAGEGYEKRYTFVASDAIARDLRRAVVAAEDTRFYDHRGIDWVEVRNAREAALRSGRPPRGASTITQQLVKNLYFTTHRSRIRKGLELSITPLAEWILGKDRILELYLNVIEWGPGVYGAEAAARHHYGVAAAAVSRDQAARLAAVIPSPLTRVPAQMNAYSATIQTRMRQMGW